MKYALFLASFLFAGIGHASAQTGEPVLKVLLTKTAMTVTCLNQPIAIKTIQALDSLMKKIPDLQRQKIEYESQNADPEQSLAIIRTLEKCNCHLTTKSIRKQE